MIVRPIDPRDITIEIQPLAYRVYFWELRNSAHDGIESTYWASHEYEMTGTSDVAEVIEWANQNADGRTYTLYAVFKPRPEELATIQLSGVDPTAQ